ncbi:hypothetical protein ATANTOWER_026240, partial [Ataeniobius toweri]|nr:hypothetical protein [Ataeniobius toweri]
LMTLRELMTEEIQMSFRKISALLMKMVTTLNHLIQMKKIHWPVFFLQEREKKQENIHTMK